MNRLVVMMPLFMVFKGAMRDVHGDADAEVSMPAPFSPFAHQFAIHSTGLALHTGTGGDPSRVPGHRLKAGELHECI